MAAKNEVEYVNSYIYHYKALPSFNELWNAAYNLGKCASTDAQQLKPKMPSFETLWDEVGLFEGDRAVCQRFYMCIARHFGR